MTRSITCLILLCTLFYISGCSDSVDPIPPTAKDPHTYSWKLDTLSFTPLPNDFEQVIMFDLWGVNDTLVYAVGHDVNSLGLMWKYNGKKWERIRIRGQEGGPLNKYSDFYCVRGFSADDIYAFGLHSSNYTGERRSYTVAVHFDGTQWHEVPMPNGQGIKSVIMASPSTIYCGGWWDGQLYRFDGVQWSVDTIRARRHSDLYVDVNVIGFSPTREVYLQTEQNKNAIDGFDYKQIVKYTKNQSIDLDSAYNLPPWGGRAFWQSKTGTIYSCGGGGVFRFSDGKWTSSLSANVVRAIYGTSDQHIFAVESHSIYYYDGESWRIIAPFNGINLEVHLWCSETQVFISYSDGVKTYILHGQ